MVRDLKQGSGISLVIDIGSGSVAGALVFFPRDKKTVPKVLALYRAPIVLPDEINFEKFLFAMTKTLGEVLGKIDFKKIGAPEEIYCFLAAPWYISQTRVAKLNRLSPFVFTKKLSEEISDREIEKLKSGHLFQTALGEELRIIEKQTFQIKLNGYKTSSPFGKRASEMEMAIFVSLAPEKVLNSIEAEILKFFNMAPHFFSFLLPEFVVARDLMKDLPHFLLLDIAGEITEVAIVKDEMLHESASFPVGKSSLAAVIAADESIPMSDAGTMLSLYLEGQLEEGRAERVGEILFKVKKNWLKSFQKTLQNLAGEFSLPSTILFTADDDAAPWFKQVLEKEEWGQYTLTDKKFDVIMLNNRNLLGCCSFLKDVKPDPFLSIETKFISRL